MVIENLLLPARVTRMRLLSGLWLLTALVLCAQPILDPVESAGHSGLPLDPAKPVIVSFVGLEEGALLPSSSVEIRPNVENYRLAPGGNRLHLLLDNLPPQEITDASQPIHFKELSEGGHCLRLIAVRPDGRALSDPQAFLRLHFYVRRRNFQNFLAPDAPLLTVNYPPDGTLDVTEGARVWLDFLLLNAPLAKEGGFRVRYKINGVENFVYDDRRVYWDNLKPGRYECEIELQQSDGTLLIGPFHSVKRTFVLRPSQRAIPVMITPTPTPHPAGKPGHKHKSSSASPDQAPPH
jgi:hypothetical protein